MGAGEAQQEMETIVHPEGLELSPGRQGWFDSRKSVRVIYPHTAGEIHMIVAGASGEKHLAKIQRLLLIKSLSKLGVKEFVQPNKDVYENSCH